MSDNVILRDTFCAKNSTSASHNLMPSSAAANKYHALR